MRVNNLSELKDFEGNYFVFWGNKFPSWDSHENETVGRSPNPHNIQVLMAYVWELPEG